MFPTMPQVETPLRLNDVGATSVARRRKQTCEPATSYTCWLAELAERGAPICISGDDGLQHGLTTGEMIGENRHALLITSDVLCSYAFVKLLLGGAWRREPHLGDHGRRDGVASLGHHPNLARDGVATASVVRHRKRHHDERRLLQRVGAVRASSGEHEHDGLALSILLERLTGALGRQRKPRSSPVVREPVLHRCHVRHAFVTFLTQVRGAGIGARTRGAQGCTEQREPPHMPAAAPTPERGAR